MKNVGLASPLASHIPLPRQLSKYLLVKRRVLAEITDDNAGIDENATSRVHLLARTLLR